MAAKRYKDPRKSNAFRYSYFFLFGLIALWLLASIIFKTSPIDLVKNSFSSFGQKVSDTAASVSGSNVMSAAEKDSIITRLQTELDICRGKGSYQKAMVIINSAHLNMRDKASLSSNIVMQIPAESIVDVLFYDKETFYLEGKAGKWARIKYSDSEGWVWGNFLKTIDQDIGFE